MAAWSEEKSLLDPGRNIPDKAVTRRIFVGYGYGYSSRWTPYIWLALNDILGWSDYIERLVKWKNWEVAEMPREGEKWRREVLECKAEA